MLNDPVFEYDFNKAFEGASIIWGGNEAYLKPIINQQLNEYCLELFKKINAAAKEDLTKKIPQFKASILIQRAIPETIKNEIYSIFKKNFDISLEMERAPQGHKDEWPYLIDLPFMVYPSHYYGFKASWHYNSPFLSATPGTLQPKPRYTLQDHYQILLFDLNDPTGQTDVVFIVGNNRHPAHRFYLSIHSEVFARMFRSGMTETSKKEIEIKEDNPAAFDHMMHFIYHGKIRDMTSLQECLHLKQLADKYMLKTLIPLVSYAILEAIQRLKITKENFKENFEFSQKHNIKELIDKCLAFVRDNEAFDLLDEQITNENYLELFKHALGKRKVQASPLM